EQIRFPRELQDALSVHGYYGTLKHDARAVYQFYMGWFDGNPANLDRLPRAEAARRYLELMGGGEQVVSAAQAAYDRGEYRWVAELLNHAVFADPENRAARELLASAYDQMGYMAESAIWRNFYLTGAQELRGDTAGIAPSPARAMVVLALAPVGSCLEAWAAALDGPGAEGKNLKLNLELTDAAAAEASYVLWIENAVLHYRRSPPAADANAGIALPKAGFLKVLVGNAGIGDLLGDSGITVTGSKLDLLSFFRLLEKPPAGFPIVTP
ncbi:MAG: MBL fold metallo-hydrolase, partial [Halioglobus sp.]|nr:MBL fold metallo-hydrolase [Halioglobus sp.]